MADYGGTMRTIISHLDLDLSNAEKRKLAKELDFYDVNESPIYRWTMTNPLVNHIDTKRCVVLRPFVYMLNNRTCWLSSHFICLCAAPFALFFVYLSLCLVGVANLTPPITLAF
jgi:hypothetical protein